MKRVVVYESADLETGFVSSSSSVDHGSQVFLAVYPQFRNCNGRYPIEELCRSCGSDETVSVLIVARQARLVAESFSRDCPWGATVVSGPR